MEIFQLDFAFICRRCQCFIRVSFILGSVLLYLIDKGMVIAVTFFSSYKSCYLSCNFVLSISCWINDTQFWNWFWLCDLRIPPVKKMFVLFVKLGFRVCYLSAILGALIGHQGNFVGLFVSYILLFVAYYFDLCRKIYEHQGTQFLFVDTWIQIWLKDVSCSNYSSSLAILFWTGPYHEKQDHQ